MSLAFLKRFYRSTPQFAITASETPCFTQSSHMKDHLFSPIHARFVLTAAISTGLALTASIAQASSLSWTSAGSSTLGGTGTWDTSGTNWWNGTSAAAWTDTTGTVDTAVFAGAGGQVPL